jgi:ankyrin repeat protein
MSIEDYEISKKFLINNKEVNKINIYSDKYKNLLLYSTIIGDFEFCKCLVEKGENPNQKYHDGFSPFVISCKKGYNQIIEYYLNIGVDLENLFGVNSKKGFKKSGLFYLLKNKNFEMIKLIKYENFEMNNIIIKSIIQCNDIKIFQYFEGLNIFNGFDNILFSCCSDPFNFQLIKYLCIKGYKITNDFVLNNGIKVYNKFKFD